MPLLYRYLSHRYWIASLLGCAVLVSQHWARAETKAELGLRLGYAVPLGETRDGQDMADATSGQIPIWLDLGVRIIPNLSVGVYGQYGFGMTGGNLADSCDQQEQAASAAGGDSSCSVTDVRVGLQAHYHFMPDDDVTDPWLGVGFGYEWLTFGSSAEGNGQTVEISSTGKGFELLNMQLGLDVLVAPGFGVGPFFAFSLAKYESYSTECSGSSACGLLTSTNGDIDDTAFHQWLFFGARGVFLP